MHSTVLSAEEQDPTVKEREAERGVLSGQSLLLQ